MPKNQYNIRSKDVQEMLTNPPKTAILWGNTIIIGLFFVFLYGLSLYRVPKTSRLQFQIIGITSLTSSDTPSMRLRVYGKMPAEINGKFKLKLKFDQNNLNRSVTMDAVIIEKDMTQGQIIVQVKSNRSDRVAGVDYRTIVFSKGMFGIAEFATGSVPLLKLFVHKMLNH